MDYTPLAFTMATPILPPPARLLLRVAMKLARGFRQYAPLARIGTIHIAGFGFVDKLRDARGVERRLTSPYLLFLSLFDGGFAQYISDFGNIIPDQIDDIWNKCVRYPGARNAGPFNVWLGSHQFTDTKDQVDSYSYFAYRVDPGSGQPSQQPTAQPAMLPLVLNALELRERLRRLADDIDDLGADGVASVLSTVAASALRSLHHHRRATEGRPR